MISQTALDHFRTSLASKKDDPYSVLLRRNKLPMALLDDAANPNLRKVCKIFVKLARPAPGSSSFFSACTYCGNRAIFRDFRAESTEETTKTRCWLIRGTW